MLRNLEQFFLLRSAIDLIDLKARDVSTLRNGVIIDVISMTPCGGKFAWDNTSSATPDDINVVLPSGHVGDGRWLREDMIGFKVEADGKISPSILPDFLVKHVVLPPVLLFEQEYVVSPYYDTAGDRFNKLIDITIDDVDYPKLPMFKANGTMSAPEDVTASDILFEISGYGWNSSYADKWVEYGNLEVATKVGDANVGCISSELAIVSEGVIDFHKAFTFAADGTGEIGGAWSNYSINNYIPKPYIINSIPVLANGQTAFALIKEPLNKETDLFFTINGVTYFYTDDFTIAPANLSVLSITRVGSVATVTTTVDHGLYTDVYVTISGADQPEYNITAVITKIASNQFTYVVSGTPATPATGTIIATFSKLTWVNTFYVIQTSDKLKARFRY